LSDPIVRPPEAVLVKRFAESLSGAGWRVDVQTVIGLYRPDIVAWAPSGQLFAIEVKSLAQRTEL
jgi:hypothetical protein